MDKFISTISLAVACLATSALVSFADQEITGTIVESSMKV